MNAKRITIYDIAAKIGVSPMTVSLALRNHYRISEKRRMEVKKMAKQMGYVPDPALAALAAYRSMNRASKVQSAIAWVNHWAEPDLLRRGYKEFDAYWEGAFKAAKQFGYHLEDIRWEPGCSAQRYEQILLARGIRGVLIPPHQMIPDWGGFDWSKFAIIRFGMSVPVPDSNLVTSDQYRAVVMAVSKIHQYGYQRIGLVAGRSFDHAVGGPYFGAFHWIQNALELKPVLPVLLTDYGFQGGQMKREKCAFKKWLHQYQPEAILTTDYETPGLLRELGYRIPQDIAVAGTSVLDIPVDAGINQHAEEIGRIALEMLVKQININERGEPPVPSRILAESHWQDGLSLPRRRR